MITMMSAEIGFEPAIIVGSGMLKRFGLYCRRIKALAVVRCRGAGFIVASRKSDQEKRRVTRSIKAVSLGA